MDENKRNQDEQSNDKQNDVKKTQPNEQQNTSSEQEPNPQGGSNWSNYRTREMGGNEEENKSSSVKDSGDSGSLY